MSTGYGISELRDGMNELGIELSNEMMDKFSLYHNELLGWNKRMNLVSRNDEPKIVNRHFLDSLDIIEFIPHNASMLDIGSGAGFPGIPIKIVRPDIKIDLLEPKLKRFNFLTHLTDTLGIEVGLYKCRAEEFSGNYDIVLSRSVGKLSWLTKVSAPLLADDSELITYKGSRLRLELNEIIGWDIVDIKPRKFCAGNIVVLKKAI